MEMRREVMRKSIHFTGVLYLPLYIFTGKTITLGVVGFLTLTALLIEMLRRKYEILPVWILNPYERKGVGAYVYFGLAALILTTFLSAEAAIVGVVVGSVGDGVSGLVKAYQKTRLRWLKGAPSTSMFFSSFLALLFLSWNFDLKLDYLALLATCVAGAFIESKQIKIKDFYINDNLSVPLLSGVLYQAVS